MPSRVALDGQGNVYVASQGFQFQGSVTKIAADQTDCIDRNNNGRIDTSTSRESLDYGEDECVLWTRHVGPPNAVLRALTVDVGDAQRPDGYVWVGGFNTRTLYKLDPLDGTVINTVETDLEPYGALVTGDGTLYVSTLGSGDLEAIDTRLARVRHRHQNPVELRNGCQGSYGITLDRHGRIWTNGWDCPDAIAYDPAENTWCRVTIPGDQAVGRGITGDSAGRIWTTVGGDGQSHVAWWDQSACQPGESNAVPDAQIIRAPGVIRGPTAIGSDSRGNIWVAHHDTPKMLKIEPNNDHQITVFEGTNRVYSYTDFTGINRRMSLGLGTYHHEFQANCDAPQWTQLHWSASIPPGSTINFSVQVADRRHKLDLATPLTVADIPGSESPVHVGQLLDAAGIRHHAFIRVKATMTLGADQSSPVLRQFKMNWSCDD